jgi:hypothetical protein
MTGACMTARLCCSGCLERGKIYSTYAAIFNLMNIPVTNFRNHCLRACHLTAFYHRFCAGDWIQTYLSMDACIEAELGYFSCLEQATSLKCLNDNKHMISVALGHMREY